MKKIIICFILAMPFNASSQSTEADQVAVLILDHMSEVIGELNSVSFDLTTTFDEYQYEYGLVREFGEHEVYMVGPNKMLVHTRNHKGHRGYWYNGETVTYYDYDENNYSVLIAPDNIVKTIDSLHYAYDLDFPAADFFYPTFTDDLLNNFDEVLYLGKKKVDGKECFHIMADREDMNVQIWIDNDAMNLPSRFIIKYKKEEGTPIYDATFSNWQVNPNVPLAIFEFVPPDHAHQIFYAPKNFYSEQ